MNDSMPACLPGWWLLAWLLGYLVACLPARPPARLPGWLVGWLVGRLPAEDWRRKATDRAAALHPSLLHELLEERLEQSDGTGLLAMQVGGGGGGDRQMDGWTDGRTDGWTDGRSDGWMDGWTDGQKN